jgi:hypothetical protein
MGFIVGISGRILQHCNKQLQFMKGGKCIYQLSEYKCMKKDCMVWTNDSNDVDVRAGLIIAMLLRWNWYMKDH